MTLWDVQVLDGNAKIYRNGIPLTSKSNGEHYGSIQKFSTYPLTDPDTGIPKELIKVACLSDTGIKASVLVKPNLFEPSSSHAAFQNCTSLDNCHSLVGQLNEALRKLHGSMRSFGETYDTSKGHKDANVTEDSAHKSTHKRKNSDSSAIASTSAQDKNRESEASEKPQHQESAKNKSSSKRRKSGTTASAAVSSPTVETTSYDAMQESCEECLVSTTSVLIPIKNLGLPVRSSRQFRRVNPAFIEILKQELIKEPSGSYGCLFVVAKDVENKDSFDIHKKDAYEYEVLGGTHLMLATQQLNEEKPENPHFSGRMARIYCGLTDDQAIHLGAMHQKSSSYCHDVTYREEVETCRAQLYKNEGQHGDPPKPSSSWRSTCAKILYKEKRNLSEVFSMAMVCKNTWDAFIKLNDLYENGKLKGQKFSSADLASGKLAVKQWYMKPLVSLPDQSKLFLLNKIISGELQLKDLKQEAENYKSVNLVQDAILAFFKIDSWELAVERYGTYVDSAKLLRFRGNFEASHDFQVFLERLKKRDAGEIPEESTEANSTTIYSGDGKTQGHVVFVEEMEEVSQSLDFFKSNFEGCHLTLACVGFNDTVPSKDEVEESCRSLVNMVNRLNFTLRSTFNCVVLCPASVAHFVVDTLKEKGATLTQQGFIHHKHGQRVNQGTTMQEVITSFVIGHWSASRVVDVNSHTNYSSPPPNFLEVDVEVGEEYPTSILQKIIDWFSKDGDTVMEVGNDAKIGNAFSASIESGRRGILLTSGKEHTRLLQKLAVTKT